MPTRQQKINAALAKMRTGQIKNVRVGPGREGLITVRKGKKKPTGFQFGMGKPRAKVITRKK